MRVILKVRITSIDRQHVLCVTIMKLDLKRRLLSSRAEQGLDEIRDV